MYGMYCTKRIIGKEWSWISCGIFVCAVCVLRCCCVQEAIRIEKLKTFFMLPHHTQCRCKYRSDYFLDGIQNCSRESELLWLLGYYCCI